MKKLERIKEERVIQDRNGGFTEDMFFALKPTETDEKEALNVRRRKESSRPREQPVPRPEMGTS